VVRKAPLRGAIRNARAANLCGVAEDWKAVARAINERVEELGWRQRELAQRSHVSQATVRELQYHTVERRRSARTLEALSTALGWHPGYLHAVLNHRQPPEPDEPLATGRPSLHSRLDTLESRMTEITERLDDVKADLATVLEYVKRGNR
jgi:transcriptional regulator with XRE-family HTH domain